MNDQTRKLWPIGSNFHVGICAGSRARWAARGRTGWTSCRDGRHKIRFSRGPYGRNSAIREAVLSSHD